MMKMKNQMRMKNQPNQPRKKPQLKRKLQPRKKHQKKAELAPKAAQVSSEAPRDKTADSRTLFVKNLPENTTEEELKALSADITALRIKAAKKPNGKNKALGKAFEFAYLEFKDDATCVSNFKSLQHKKIREKEIVVDYVDDRSAYTKKEEKKTAEKVKDMKRLHVGGFDKTASEADLKKLFSGCAEFTLPIKKDTKLNMGFAFVTYANEEAATKSLKAIDGKDFNGKKLSVANAFVRPEKVEKKIAAKKEAAAEPAAKKQKGENGAVAKADAKKAAVAAVATPAKKETLKRKAEESEDDDDEDEDDDDEDDDEDDEDDDDEDDDEDDDDEEDDDEDDDDEDDDGADWGRKGHVVGGDDPPILLIKRSPIRRSRTFQL